MANKLLDEVREKMEDEQAIRGALNLFVWLIIIAVVTLCEIMYIKIMVTGFPDGLVQAIAIVGAVATGLSVIALYAGKNYWFSKGHQTWAAWAFTGVEIGVLVLNVLLAFNFNSTSGVLQFWKQAYPAAPIIALVGWGFILYLDRENIMRRRQRDMDEKEHDAELKYEHLVHKTRMAVKTTSLGIVADKLAQKVESTENLAALDRIADTIYQGLLGEISGKHYTQIPGARVVDSTLQKPAQLAQSAETSGADEAKTDVPRISESEIPLTMNKIFEALGIKRKETQASTPVPPPPHAEQLSPEELQRRYQWLLANVPMLGSQTPVPTTPPQTEDVRPLAPAPAQSNQTNQSNGAH